MSLAATPTSTVPIALPGIPSLSAQWESARLQAAAAQKLQEEATEKLLEQAVQKFLEADERQNEQRVARQQGRSPEVATGAAMVTKARNEDIAMENPAATLARSQSEEKAKAAAQRALENLEEIDLAAFPQIIADGKWFDLDPVLVAEMERVYREKAICAFQAQRAEYRLLQALHLGRADTNEWCRDAQVVVRTVTVPFPVVVTTQVTNLSKEPEEGSMELKKEAGLCAELADEESSTCADTQLPMASPSPSDAGDAIFGEYEEDYESSRYACGELVAL